MSTRARIGLVGLIISGVLVALVTMTSAGAESFHVSLARFWRRLFVGISEAAVFTGSEFNFITNVFMFVPLGFFLGLMLSRRRYWVGFAVLPLTSALIEGIQWFMPTRGTQLMDFLANSLGGWVGLAVAAALLNVWDQIQDRRKTNRVLDGAPKG